MRIKKDIEYIYQIYDDVLGDFEVLSAEEQTEHMTKLSEDRMNLLIDYVYSNYDNFRLFLKCGDSGKYADFIHNMVKRVVDSTIAYIKVMKNAPIIILDEATANVDPENEKDLMNAVEALTKEKTIIMIAHRLKTVRHADQIVVVESGKISQLGTHDELIKQEGIYKRFIGAREQAVSWKLVH